MLFSSSLLVSSSLCFLYGLFLRIGNYQTFKLIVISLVNILCMMHKNNTGLLLLYLWLFLSDDSKSNLMLLWSYCYIFVHKQERFTIIIRHEIKQKHRSNHFMTNGQSYQSKRQTDIIFVSTCCVYFWTVHKKRTNFCSQFPLKYILLYWFLEKVNITIIRRASFTFSFFYIFL